MSIFTEIEEERIANAIAEAEKATSGEIRIALDKYCEGDAYEKAIQYFSEMDMDKTRLHNGVLIYMAYEDHKFAIVGDKGINKVVPPNFWETTKVAMKAHFSAGNLADGIIAGVLLAGEELAKFFPYQGDDINELSNEIVYLNKP
ncbi:TPM domain-containing protein [Pedobacter flavus]|uniref:TPM domain-containing protein n=1 Tax=Pedobacter flavus TaxID=3113906 RepID=A0ABU7GYA2_9SPHI|nr:TPM domain-containing protein [Pedobacter sp. VNH31]MEE1883960.1 TPM domain-containing protein [Pedobacter sp. VNH31]